MEVKLNSIAKCFDAVSKVLENLPASWVDLTTHRLDVYNEAQAKSQFLEQLQALLLSTDLSAATLEALPTAYDYIRLGHQLSSILEWVLSEINGVSSDQVITFTSKTMPVLAIIRNNTLRGKQTHIYYNTESSPLIDVKRLEDIYGYNVQLNKVADASKVPAHSDGAVSDGIVIFVTKANYEEPLTVNANIDVTVNLHAHYGSAMIIHNADKADVVKNVQHVRRRETIAMTPPNALNVLHEIVNNQQTTPALSRAENEVSVHNCIKHNTGSTVTPLVASSGLSIQYAILMGLVENAMTQYPGKAIKIILPPNCYGGTNDQARRIADLNTNIEIVDLPVDGGHDLVSSLDVALKASADSDSVPLVLAEIPTNPRVEVPNMTHLAAVLSASRTTPENAVAVDPVFIVDQTFCPNVKLLGMDSELVKTKLVSFSSGSKFPSGGRCIAGYCAVNDAAQALQAIISNHLALTDNSAVAHQMNTLAENMPSMPARITKAYHNARQFVEHIQSVLPQSKINFVSAELAEQGFTPSVFSLDLPCGGDTAAQREENQRVLNKKLIDFMIDLYPGDSKYCVSYGQLKGCYWTIPATSTQGTTKEGDKDYVVRVAMSPASDVTKLSQSFTDFCRNENLI
jgi:cystathionine beta-lyase/cystathionine gamma-synthase